MKWRWRPQPKPPLSPKPVQPPPPAKPPIMLPGIIVFEVAAEPTDGTYTGHVSIEDLMGVAGLEAIREASQKARSDLKAARALALADRRQVKFKIGNRTFCVTPT